MNVVLDENVSKSLAQALKEMGFSVFTVAAELVAGVDDEKVFDLVLKHQAILITRDYHFTDPFRFDAEKTQGIVYIHNGNLTSEKEITLVTDFFRNHLPTEFKGKLVTLYSNDIRIR